MYSFSSLVIFLVDLLKREIWFYPNLQWGVLVSWDKTQLLPFFIGFPKRQRLSFQHAIPLF